MATTAEAPANPRSQQPKNHFSRKTYFLAYNGISLALWATITLRAIVLIPILSAHDRLFHLYEALHQMLTFTQTIAVLEVMHALVGIVRASRFTTAMQVASRLFLVWGIVGPFPEIIVKDRTFGPRVQHYAGSKGGPLAYAGVLLAWGTTECIRYGFFVWRESSQGGRVPDWLIWLRYNTFFILYPVGIISEGWLIYSALEPAAESVPAYNMFMKATLLIYVPGGYILYTHMMSQRRRVMKGKAKSQ